MNYPDQQEEVPRHNSLMITMAAETSSAQLLQGGVSEFGLEGNIVTIVKDRGEQDYRKDFGASSDNPPHPREPVPLKELADILNKAREESFYESLAYIPRKILEEIMSLSQITKIMPELECFKDQDEAEHDGLARMICFGTHGKPPCRKLLAALVRINCAGLIKCAMDDGMSDDCLPLWFAPRDREFFLKCQNQNHEHSKLNQALSNTVDRENLKRYTHSLTAPYLKQLPDKHFHYVLERDDHLPMETLGQVLGNPETNHIMVSNKENTDYHALGGFGKVFKVQINPSHWNFVSRVDFYNGNTVSESPQKRFALKQLNDNRPDVFEEELKSLLFCLHHKFVDEKLLEEGQKHMAHIRASFEIRNKTNNSTDYFLLFDWQDGNLTQLWENGDRLRNDENHPRCMAQQIFGLAAALQCVHNDRTAHQRSNPAQNHYSVYGRHGDLGPSNILYSVTESGLELKLADFGLAQLHSRMSRTFGNTKFTHRTETYRGPEFDVETGEISRATDIFSFGCVILEYITWYLLGNDGVKEFSETRFEAESHRPGFKSDAFFSIHSSLSKVDKVVLKPQVLGHIKNLNKNRRCSWYLHQMLELVEERMLNLDPKKRIQSSQLTKDLHAFRETCNVDQSYYTGYWNSVPRKPSWDLRSTA
ncbi:kinase-like domain-containing protein [Lasiosphaeria miniovina]|uniref:Kinase-like domain-containing protein n=1 Tax=Lasiosphaeria miniovina TaxID=1954250 RepID=A0AA40AAU8_9PEZI|nr:kinase-like domain-containing protein [Lasiosphaeria miniovina]KAK0712484.1 kinase-like domain-containing protein [Lasiosphaeria miniovina]